MTRTRAVATNAPVGAGLRRFLVLAVAFAWLAIACDVPRESTAFKGGPAPAFEITAFNKEFADRAFSLEQLRGQIIVLNFWASWCPECEHEMPAFEEAWRRYRDQGVWFIGVDYMDFDEEALAMLERYQITYPNGPDRGTEISKRYRVTGVPETIFIDRNGIVQEVHLGPVSRARVKQVIEQMLSQPSGEAPGA